MVKKIFRLTVLVIIAAVLASALLSCAGEETKSASITTTLPLPDNARKVSSSSDGAFSYDVYNDYAEVVDYIGKSAVVSVPSSYEGVPVASIGKSAFYGNANITSVTLPITVVNIANKAFAKCTNLTEIVMPGVKAFGMEAFRGSGLREVTLPAVLENFGKYCLAETALETVTLPESIIRSGDYIFAGCQSLVSVTFAVSTTEITTRMFYNCPSITEMIIPAQITKIGAYAFSACQNLQKLYIPATVTTIGEGLFYNSPQAVIVTTKGSPAEKYAQKNNLTCEIVKNI